MASGPQFSNIVRPAYSKDAECVPEGRKVNGFNFLFSNSPQIMNLPFPFDIYGDQNYYGAEIDPFIDSTGAERMSQICALIFDWQVGVINTADASYCVGPLYIYNEYLQFLNTIQYIQYASVEDGSDPYGEMFVRGVIPFFMPKGNKVIVALGVSGNASSQGSLSLAFANFEVNPYHAQGTFGYND